jgi:hypothetical protein
VSNKHNIYIAQYTVSRDKYLKHMFTSLTTYFSFIRFILLLVVVESDRQVPESLLVLERQVSEVFLVRQRQFLESFSSFCIFVQLLVVALRTSELSFEQTCLFRSGGCLGRILNIQVSIVLKILSLQLETLHSVARSFPCLIRLRMIVT